MQINGFELLAIPVQRALKLVRDYADSGNISKAITLERVINMQIGSKILDGNNSLALVKIPTELC